ncbi:histone acetylation protein-domain-containing protein [Phycomyces blakesleeanus]|uniref:histone acetyltransferase n=1 Tax=Phycomyces blakesleeanus TaxID=4837 RepID=A0ABR3APL5_PHYBL
MTPFYKELKRLLEPLEKGSLLEIHDIPTIPIPCKKLTVNSKGDFKQTRRLILITTQSLGCPKAIVCGMETIEYREYHPEGRIESSIYISKVDTTGYPSIKNITAIMIQAYLISLGPCKVYVFACAQPQYLFRDSANYCEKKTKTLGDRALIGWWRNILSHPTLSIKKTKGWWSIPGVDDERQAVHATGNRLKNIPGVVWKYGYPYDPKANIKDVIPLFEDDTKARLSAALCESKGGRDSEDTINVEGFWEILGHTEECGAGRLTAFLVLDLTNRTKPKDNTTEKMIMRKSFTRIWNTMMDLFFDTKENIEKSTKKLEATILEYRPAVEPYKIHTLGDPVDKRASSSVDKNNTEVRTLSSNLIKKKAGSTSPANGLESSSIKTSSAENTPVVNVLGNSLIKRKTPVSVPAVNVLRSSLIKRKTTENTPKVNTLEANSIKRKTTGDIPMSTVLENNLQKRLKTEE